MPTAYWAGLLFGPIAAGCAAVVFLASGWRGRTLALSAGLAGLSAAILAFIQATQSFHRTDVTVAVGLLAIGAYFGGWLLASSAMPVLLGARGIAPLGALPEGDALVDVILLADAEPERYRLSYVVTLLQALTDSGALVTPDGALPILYVSERARYTAVGGTSPSRPAFRAFAEAVRTKLASEPGVGEIRIAWCRDGREGLATAVRSATAAGRRRVAILPVEIADTHACDHERRLLDELKPAERDVRTTWSRALWEETAVADLVARRAMAAAKGSDVAETGFVLVGHGVPPEWDESHPAASEQETYFIQRVRMLLTDRGYAEQNVREAWLEWQLPDVTESVRHLAALGCRRICVVPATLLMPSIALMLDVTRSVVMARVDEAAVVEVLPALGDDPIIVEVVAERARILIEELAG
ncbi:MAG: ferrochelatase [Coriobacteriia bacterium]